MKFAALFSIFILPLTLHAQQLESFVQNLDKNLRAVKTHEADACIEDAAPARLSSRKTATFKNIKATVLTEKEAQDLFKEFQADKDLAFNFPDAGCWERTYEMSRRLLDKGITPLKSFMNSEGDRGALIRVANPKKKGETLTWNNHVAPVVLVEKNGQIIPFTIDPTLEKAAVPTTEWQKTLTKIKPPGEVSLSYLPVTKASPTTSMSVSYSDPSYIQSNQKELKMYRELGDDPEKASEWYFQKYNEELKAGGGY